MDGLDLATLASGYRDGKLTVSAVIDEVLARISAAGDDHVWISRIPEHELRRRAHELQRMLEAQRTNALPPLFGAPFAVKDSIDVAGLPTTAACPAFTYEPSKSAPIVERLLRAGAICVGKTNLDQFASGLVGVRSPYGVSRNPFDERYIPGGSSSGSAVAVSSGLVSFSLGTDAAGSGRVPAALTNIVGLKPTRGLLSTDGCVPACRSIDCPSILASSVGEAWRVLDTAAGFIEHDPYSRPDTRQPSDISATGAFRFGVPAEADLFFDDDREAQRLFQEAVALLEYLGGSCVKIDFAPFRAAATLLYEGPWVADRLAPLQAFLKECTDDVQPVTRAILTGGERYSAVDAYAGLHELTVLKRSTSRELGLVDALVLPTTPTTYTVAEVRADPLELNRRLGHYTNFVNLLDLSALAVPNGFRDDGLPMGITLVGPAFHDATLAVLGRRFHLARGSRSGALNRPIPDLEIPGDHTAQSGTLNLAVAGAHLSGESMNWEFNVLGASLVRSTRTAAEYCLVALPDFDPPRPGLVRVGPDRGSSIEVEVWSIPLGAFGGFAAAIPAPLLIGTVILADGTSIKGFLCEEYATTNGVDITHLGGWRSYAPRNATSVNSN
ncbi:MAG: allophanate hydrolase [Solirubrobacteraceae bacterium]